MSLTILLSVTSTPLFTTYVASIIDKSAFVAKVKFTVVFGAIVGTTSVTFVPPFI